jgi:hypothetical protein
MGYQMAYTGNLSKLPSELREDYELQLFSDICYRDLLKKEIHNFHPPLRMIYGDSNNQNSFTAPRHLQQAIYEMLGYSRNEIREMFGRLQRHFPTAPHWLANAASGTS